MKNNWVVTTVLGLLFSSLTCARGQGTSVGDGTFVNFDFESANVPPPQGGQFATPVAVADALPGWTAYLGTGQISSVVPNLSSLAGASISIITPQWGGGPVIQGSYMVLIQAAEFPSSLTPTTAALAQTGRIPDGAQTIFFNANTTGLQLTFNGAAIPTKVYGRAANYTVYEGSISSIAGQTGELRFTVPQVPGVGAAFLDNISFVGVPEPCVTSLLVFGMLALLGARGSRGSPGW